MHVKDWILSRQINHEIYKIQASLYGGLWATLHHSYFRYVLVPNPNAPRIWRGIWITNAGAEEFEISGVEGDSKLMLALKTAYLVLSWF